MEEQPKPGKYNAQFSLVDTIIKNTSKRRARKLYDILMKRLERDLPKKHPAEGDANGK